MSDALAYVQNQILDFSMEEQLYLLAYIANNINKQKSEKSKAFYIANNINKQKSEKSKAFVRKAGIGKDPDFYMSSDFDEPLEDFAEYM